MGQCNRGGCGIVGVTFFFTLRSSSEVGLLDGSFNKHISMKLMNRGLLQGTWPKVKGSLGRL